MAHTLGSWEDPWSASLIEEDDGSIRYISDGQDTMTYDSREEAIEAQQEWLQYTDSTDEEERAWAQMAQQIIDALRA